MIKLNVPIIKNENKYQQNSHHTVKPKFRKTIKIINNVQYVFV